MSRKRAVDICIALTFTAMVLIAGLYREQISGSTYLMVGAGIAAIVFFVLAIGSGETGWQSAAVESTLITEAVLLSEENTELMTWNMYGKVALVIGRNQREHQVDIDLRESPFASMVDGEHAVLNFSGGSWFVEDLGSTNGLSIKKDDRKIYKLAPDTLCRVERGDCLFVGRNQLLFR